MGFARDDVLVAHNAPFDLRFLTYERRRTAGRYFTQPWLDTLTLATAPAGRDASAAHDLATLVRVGRHERASDATARCPMPRRPRSC